LQNNSRKSSCEEYLSRLGVATGLSPTFQIKEAYTRVIEEELREREMPSLTSDAEDVVQRSSEPPMLSETGNGIVFTFPGQGALNIQVLADLYRSFPETSLHFEQADRIVSQLLGHGIVTAVLSDWNWDQSVPEYQDLSQIGIYLTGVLLAEILRSRGVEPALMLGHSFGELTALAAARACSIETGVELVCQRILALRNPRVEGRMAALNCGPETVRGALSELAPHSLEIAVMNHSKQTVVSGPQADIDRLRSLCQPRRVSMMNLTSPFPFHSSHLAGAVEPFRRSIAHFAFGPTDVPVYQTFEGGLYTPSSDVARSLARQFTQQLDFSAAVSKLRRAGFSRFVECGASSTLTTIVRKNFVAGDSAVLAVLAVNGASVRAGVECTLHALGALTPAPNEPADGKIEYA
jgi:malonyl CoA-acyl carrier protein transacylase